MPYPTHKFRITNTTYATIEYLNEIQDNVKSMVQDFYYAKGSFTTLNSMMKQLLTTAGLINPSSIRHIQLSDVTASQHHRKYHASTHISGDTIPSASATGKGLVTAPFGAKIVLCASKANRMNLATLSYNGDNNSSGQYFSLGFRPLHVMVFYDNDTDAGSAAFDGRFMTETIWGVSHSWRHQIAWANDSGIEHRSQPVNSSVRITTYGIKVFGILNRATAAGQTISKYHVLAYRAD